jgi:uncharacterized protein (DUF1800 family)
MASSVRSDVALLYRRAGFGLRPDELDRAAAAGYEASVDALVTALTAGGPGQNPPAPTLSAGAPPPAKASPAVRQAFDRSIRADVASLQGWWTDLMISTPAPLVEKLTLYWHGHFATGVSKVRDAKLMYLQNQLFRSAGGGGFERLTQAVAKDGAMMIWLDTNTDKAAHPNENFAREMMELFTLGVGNYTQADVVDAARGFTGWTYDRRDYRYVFRPAQHDFGSKTYLGQTGDWNGEDIVHIAVTRPVSARFVVASVWSHFAYPVTPADPVVSDLLPAYGEALSVSGLLRGVFLHPDFVGPASRTGLVKQPIEWLVGAARSLGLTSDLGAAAAGRPGRSLPQLATALGQTLFNPPNVGGWGQNGYWLDTATAQLRLDAALLLAARADLSSLRSTPASGRPAAVADLLSLDGFGPTTAAALSAVAADPVQLLALALCSPEYVLA